MALTYYEKRYVVTKYTPGFQIGCNDEIIAQYEFRDEDEARAFIELSKTDDELKGLSWISYRIGERFAPVIVR